MRNVGDGGPGDDKGVAADLLIWVVTVRDEKRLRLMMFVWMWAQADDVVE
jgi:hypothetical protein